MNTQSEIPYLYGQSAIEYLIKNRIAYDEALGIKNSLGKQAAAELAAMCEAISEAREAIARIKPFMYERGMEGETDYERAVLVLWDVLAKLKQEDR